MALTQHWKLDDNAASTTVVATVGSNGTLAGGDNTNVKATSGPGGTITWAFDLNGTDDYVDVSAAAINTGGDFTFSLWVNLDSVTTQYLWGRAATNFRHLLIVNSTTLRFSSSASDSDFTVSTLSTGTWYHVFMTRTGTTVRAWINGTESSTGSLTNNGTITLDSIFRRNASYANGRVTQVRFFNSDESASVATYYAEGVSAGGGHPAMRRMFGRAFRPTEVGREGALVI